MNSSEKQNLTQTGGESYAKQKLWPARDATTASEDKGGAARHAGERIPVERNNCIILGKLFCLVLAYL